MSRSPLPGSESPDRSPPTGDLELLTVTEACAVLRISRWTLYRLMQERQLATIKIGSRRLIPRDALLRLLQQLAEDNS